MNILATLKNAWKTEDLKKKIIFTFFIILLFRIGSNIPVPFVNADALNSVFNNSTGNLLGYFNMLSGGAMSAGVIFALTIQPYINSSIIIQLLTVAIPQFQRWQKDGGEEGRKKLRNITRYLSVAIACLLAYGYYTILSSNHALQYTYADGAKGWIAMFTICLTLVAGSCLVVWLGECVDEKGIGNGISVILFASIVSRGSSLLASSLYLFRQGMWWVVLIMLVVFLAIIVCIVFMDAAERRIPIQYAKRQIGRKVYGGQSTHLPIKVAMTGVMPIIFAFAIIGVPATIAQFFPDSAYADWLDKYFSTTTALYMILTFVLIILFNYFYLSIQYDPVEISNNIKNNGGTIPGIRPGKPTSDFIIRCVNRVTLCGAMFLGVVAVLPYIIEAIMKAMDIEAAAGLAVGGTSVMILVSVALETVRSLESQMLMRHYKGFLD